MFQAFTPEQQIQIRSSMNLPARRGPGVPSRVEAPQRASVALSIPQYWRVSAHHNTKKAIDSLPIRGNGVPVRAPDCRSQQAAVALSIPLNFGALQFQQSTETNPVRGNGVPVRALDSETQRAAVALSIPLNWRARQFMQSAPLPSTGLPVRLGPGVPVRQLESEQQHDSLAKSIPIRPNNTSPEAALPSPKSSALSDKPVNMMSQ